MARRKRSSRKTWLGALALFGALLLFVLASRASVPEAINSPFRIQPQVGLAGLINLTELQLVKMEEALELVAMSDAAASLQWDRIEPPLRWVRDHNVPALVWFALPDGSYWTVDGGKAAGNLSDRDYFPKVLAGEVVIGDLVVSHATARHSAIVAVPIQRGEEVIGVLGASVFLDDLSALLARELAVEPPLVFYAFDSTPLVAIASQPEAVLLDPKQLGSPSLSRAVDQMLATEEGVARYQIEGKQQVVIYRKSALLGWWFVFGVERGGNER